MPPEKYVEIYRNKYGKVEKGIIYNTARIFINGEYYWNIKLLNTEPEYLENLICNIMQILKEQEEEKYNEGYEKGYNDAKQEIRNFLEIKENKL